MSVREAFWYFAKDSVIKSDFISGYVLCIKCTLAGDESNTKKFIRIRKSNVHTHTYTHDTYFQPHYEGIFWKSEFSVENCLDAFNFITHTHIDSITREQNDDYVHVEIIQMLFRIKKFIRCLFAD